MKPTADTIWRVPAYLPYLQPALTDETVAAVETEVGYKLPAEYLNLLTNQNGGYIRFSLPEIPHSMIAGIGPHFPSLTGFRWKRKGLVPFDGNGHWHLCLDYRKNSTAPAVTYSDNEIRSQRRIADSFAGYLAKLEIKLAPEEHWAEFVLEGLADIESAVGVLSSALNADFLPPDNDLYGYPLHRCRMGSEDKPDWISISPNQVPRGFVRHSDRRYANLKDLMPGKALRFLNVPADSYILTMPKAIQSQMMEACARCRLNVRQLREYLKDI